jgi:environmental stress-induced protein Ves
METELEFVPFASLSVAPWKNGGGLTREIAVCHDLASHQDFLWRISMATVSKPGPFSRFDEVDRTIAVLQGEGIVLNSNEGATSLTRGARPYSFDGEMPVTASLIYGETTDLNAMTRRGHFTHTMERLTFRRPISLDGECDETVLVFNSNVTTQFPAGQCVAHPLDAVRGIKRGQGIGLSPENEGEVFVIRISRAAPDETPPGPHRT